MTAIESMQTEPPGDRTGFENTPIRPLHVPKDALASVPSSETLPNPVGLTESSSEKEEDDEWSDENIAKWLERDRLDPDLEPWVRATLGE